MEPKHIEREMGVEESSGSLEVPLSAIAAQAAAWLGCLKSSLLSSPPYYKTLCTPVPTAKTRACIQLRHTPDYSRSSAFAQSPSIVNSPLG